MDTLDAGLIFPAAIPRGVGNCGEILDCVGSTMDVARQRLAGGCSDGYTILAESQEAGRGREGAWICPAGAGILMSVVLRLPVPTRDQRLIILTAAVATAEALNERGVTARIKWPNDVVVCESDGRCLSIRKLGGVLVERVAVAGGPAAYIVGLGLNVNQEPEMLPTDAALEPTSMRIERNRIFDRSLLCRSILRHIDVWYRRLSLGHKERVLARWRSMSCLLGERVQVRVGEEEFSGKVSGIRSTGELVFDAASGRRMFLRGDRAKLLL
jgi:BirA family biotin operon repressor/biotin-[acetyl-CoA-carboxylase] ligase